MRRSTRFLAWIGVAVALFSGGGCAASRFLAQNPATVVNPNYDYVYDTTIEVVEKYFDVAYENRYDGRIETVPLSGATLFEPWRLDAVGFAERFEGSIQTIRRRGYFLIQPTPTGGFTISVEVYKELEDMPILNLAPFGGGGVYIPSIQPIQQQIVAAAVEAPAGWISRGRDAKLEAVLLNELQSKIDFTTPVE
ncbi:MAG: hypothetical protein ACRDD1_14290 [Planctomycetia bacterium]